MDDVFLQYLRDPNRESLAAVVDQCHGWVWSSSLRLARNPEDAADVCQDVFLRLLVNPPRPDSVRSPRGFLVGCILDAVKQIRRSARRRHARELEAVARATQNGLPTEDLLALHDAVSKLPEALRRPVELRYFLGLSNQEIAEALRIAERTVKHRLNRAREELRRRLAPAVAAPLPLDSPVPSPVEPPPPGLLSDLLGLGGAILATKGSAIQSVGLPLAAGFLIAALSLLLFRGRDIEMMGGAILPLINAPRGIWTAQTDRETLRTSGFGVRLRGRAVSAPDREPIREGTIIARRAGDAAAQASSPLAGDGRFSFAWLVPLADLELGLESPGLRTPDWVPVSILGREPRANLGNEIDIGDIVFRWGVDPKLDGMPDVGGRSEMNRRAATALLPVLAPLTLSAAWTPGPPLPETRTGLAAARDSAGRIHAIGGSINGGLCGHQLPSTAVFLLDPDPGASWVPIAPLNLGREFPAATTDMQGRIYAIGGLPPFNNTATEATERFDHRTGVWEMVAPMPAPRVNHRAVTARDGTIWVLGGIESAITPLPVNTVFIYDPSTDSWSEGPSMLSGRKEFGAAVDRQGRIYVLGGEVDDKGVPDSTEIYDPATGRWEYGPPRPSHGCSRGCLVGGCAIDPCDRIYLIGGWSGGAGHQMDDLDRFDPSTGTWEQLEGMPEPTAGLAAVSTANGKIFVIGGERGDWCATEQVFILDIPTEECVPHFMRGDVDDNGLLTIGDAIMILEYLLLRGDPPSCADTADTDNDGQFTMADAIALLNYEFCGGAPLAEPGYSCGPDPDTPPEPWPAEDCDYRSCR